MPESERHRPKEPYLEQDESVLRDRLAAIVEGSDDAIYSKDVRGLIDSWNPGAERLYGYPAEEALGQHVSLIVPPDRKGEETRILNRILTGERVEHYETERVTKTGEIVEVSITVSPVRTGSGRIVGASVIARNIADRRRLEELQRTLDRTEFIARAAHELRNPLTTLVGFASMLAEGGDLDEAKRRRFAEAIARQGEAVNGLLHDLLDLSYMESGKYQMELEPVDMDAIVARALETAPPPEGKEVHAEIPDDTTVVGDSARLSQVFVNLVNNAYKYGGDRIRIEAQPAGDRVRVTVADNGSGIPERIRDSLFEPFMRGHANVPGSGLGLAITSRLIQAHGGDIRLDSDARGCRFLINLPRPAPA